MKNILLLTLAVAIVSAVPYSSADIQDPPGCRQGVTRKLSRALSNIFYGPMEIPHQYARTRDTEGEIYASSVGLLKGVERSVVRMGYGIVELITFPLPSYKGTYRQPYVDSRVYPHSGLEEFAPGLGVSSEKHLYNDLHY